MTLAHFGDVAAGKPAVISDSGSAMSFAELEARSNQLAHHLRERGLAAGDRIAFVLPNLPEVFVITWAAQRAGLYYTAISTRLGASEAEYIVRDCGAQALIVSTETLELADGLHLPGVSVRLLVGDERAGWPALDCAIAAYPTTPISDQTEGADMLYSSGTTGVPKGVKPPLRGLPFPAASPVAGLVSRLMGARSDTVYLSPAPIYHAAPLRFTMGVHRLGGTVVLMEHFDAVRFLELIDRYRVTFTQVVPTMLVRLLKLPEEQRTAHDLSSLDAVLHAAAPCPADVKDGIIRWLGPIVHEYYGGTEGNGFVYCDSAEWLAHRGTVGRSLLGPLHILDDQGVELPTGETGTVYFEHSGFEYHRDPEKTRQSRDPRGRGWSTLGDIGHVDADGYLYLTDRKAHMIISGGVNIYPQEAENVLTMHPAVADVAVFGIPDAEMGERVHAVVETQTSVEPSNVLARELIEYCRAQLAHYKCPRAVDFRPELPRHPNGKLYKRLLRDEYARRSLNRESTDLPVTD